MTMPRDYDVIVVGGGPAGATAAETLARAGRSVLLLDKAGRIKPCGGAIPPRLIEDFAIPEALLVAKARTARVIAPSKAAVDMPIENGFVGMVDREDFDERLRERAADAGADRIAGDFRRLERNGAAGVDIIYRPKGASRDVEERVHARIIIGADGARSEVGRQAVPGAHRVPFVFAYHEIVSVDEADALVAQDDARCDVIYDGDVSPDFYGWVFPHGRTASVGVGSAHKGFSLRNSVSALRASAGLAGAETKRCEGAPIPLKAMKRWDNRRDVILAGDAAGVVAPASGEGIYYAMASARLVAEAVDLAIAENDPRALAQARKRFMKEHGKTFWILGIMQHFWYRNDKRRERFVAMCKDPDVQRLTWEAYMHKRLVRRKPAAHAKIFFKDLGHLFGVSST